MIGQNPFFLSHNLGSKGRSAAATRLPSSARRLYVDDAFLVSITSSCMPSPVIYDLILGGTNSTRAPVPNTRISGFGTTTSNMDQCSLVQPSHLSIFPDTIPVLTVELNPPFGTSHKNTFPSKNITGPVKTSPSASLMPVFETERTWTGGGMSEARMLVSVVGRSVRRVGETCIFRGPSCVDKAVGARFRHVRGRRSTLSTCRVDKRTEAMSNVCVQVAAKTVDKPKRVR